MLLWIYTHTCVITEPVYECHLITSQAITKMMTEDVFTTETRGLSLINVMFFGVRDDVFLYANIVYCLNVAVELRIFYWQFIGLKHSIITFQKLDFCYHQLMALFPWQCFQPGSSPWRETLALITEVRNRWVWNVPIIAELLLAVLWLVGVAWYFLNLISIFRSFTAKQYTGRDVYEEQEWG